MGTVRTEEFRKDAVRIALTSGLSRKQIADDLGVGVSTLNKWITAHRDTDVVSSVDRELALENERLRRENRILREERNILKKGHPVLREPKAVRFRFVEEHSGAFPTERLCQVMNVSPRGLRAFRSRPASRRQHMDMVVLAHIAAGYRLGRKQPHEARPGDPGAENGHCPAITAQGLHLPQRSPLSRFANKPLSGNGQPILFTRLSEGPARAWVQDVNER